MIKEFMNEESGQGMAEYALIVGLIGVALIAVLTKMKGSIKGVFDRTSESLDKAVTDGGGTAPASPSSPR